MKPSKSYRIWFSQRNGSTVLCKALEQTGIAGLPGEYLNVMEFESLAKKYGVNSYTDLRDQLWKLGTTNNGVFGMKHSMHTTRFDRIIAELDRLKGSNSKNESPYSLLDAIFPRCKHIYLTRRNKIRQAVSWWKAIKDNIWHLQTHEQHIPVEDFFEQNYDFAAILHLFKEANLRECVMQEYFSQREILPLTLVYEDFVQDLGQTLRQVLDFLEIEYPPNAYDNLKMPLQRTANIYSEKWVQRFRMELQREMGDVIW